MAELEFGKTVSFHLHWHGIHFSVVCAQRYFKGPKWAEGEVLAIVHELWRSQIRESRNAILN